MYYFVGYSKEFRGYNFYHAKEQELFDIFFKKKYLSEGTDAFNVEFMKFDR